MIFTTFNKIFYRAMMAGLLSTMLVACSPNNNEPALEAGSQIAAATETPLPQLGSEQAAGTVTDTASTIAGAEATIEAIDIAILESFPVQVNVKVQGSLPDSCVSIEQISQKRVEYGFSLAVMTTRLSGAMCIDQQQSFEEIISLEVIDLPAGVYAVTASSANQLESSFELTMDNSPPAPVTKPDSSQGVISGIVWHDYCEFSEDRTPSAGCLPDENNIYRANGIFDTEEERIAGVQVWLRSGECPGIELEATTSSDVNGEYSFNNVATGLYCVSIDALTEANADILSSGNWTYPAFEIGYGTIMIEANERETIDFGWDYRLDSVAGRGQESGCFDEAAYIADITIPDNSSLAPGEPFVKTWRIQNNGDCTWGPNYHLVFAEGDLLEAAEAILLQEIVQPGDQVDLSVPMVAPLEAGAYRGDWLLQNGTGEHFGSQGDYPFYVQIVVEESSGSAPLPEAPSQNRPTGGAITGLVWKDFCGLLANGSPTAGCVSNGTGGYRADGFFNNGEERISGVEIMLRQGECPGGDVVTTTTTDANGSYQLAGLRAGSYCVTIDPQVEQNRGILLPGSFTYPAPNSGRSTIDILADETQTADFGWNYHLAGR